MFAIELLKWLDLDNGLGTECPINLDDEILSEIMF